jgi:predicted nuclease of predicted toxin-antitoxin system
VKFLVDANLPPALARWLAAEGEEAYHARDLRFEALLDRELWEHARELGACIITKDEDFVLLQALEPNGPSVIWVRIGNASRNVLLTRIPAIWPKVREALQKGERIVEVR